LIFLKNDEARYYFARKNLIVSDFREMAQESAANFRIADRYLFGT